MHKETHVEEFSKKFKAFPLPISQNTEAERLHKDFARGIQVYYEESFSNNAANACAFISVTLARLLLSDTGSTSILQHAMQDKIIKTAKLII